ncbi:MAG: FAD:protein FMN transferase [Caldilineaceae bacterium]
MNAELPTWPTHSFRAMGSQITLWLETNADSATGAFAQAEALFAANERTLSRFDPASELSALNRHGGEWFAVSPLLWDVVNQALELTARTGGLFDPTLLNALEAAGYTHSFALMQAAGDQGGQTAPHKLPLQHNAWAAIELDPNRPAIKLPKGVRLDLGGIGKGYTAQQAVRLLGQWGPCLVDAGGDVAAGAAPQGLPGWPVAVAAPSAEDHVEPDADNQAADDLLQLWLAEATLATSGVDYRRWRQGGRWRHHLIDPRTGEPAETDLLTVSVLHKNAACAEAWAKAALLLGAQAGFNRLDQQDMAAVLALADGRVWLTPAMATAMAALCE